MTPFKQLIRPGQSGSDVTAVKRALVKMHVAGSGSLNIDNFAGTAFVACIKTVQRNHHLKSDGIYGAATHTIIAPNFDLHGVVLYKSAAIRNPPLPPFPIGTAQANARKLLEYHSSGQYTSDNPGDLPDIQRTANGQAVWSQGGYWVHVDDRVFQVLVWLIEAGHKIGTYAICSDHSNDGPHGHAGGFAVDIDRIDGISVAVPTEECKANVLEIANLLHATPSGLAARQLICGGYGNIRDSGISAFCIPAADSFYGSVTMSQHCNHLHVGF